jgi:hypothetical protein
VVELLKHPEMLVAASGVIQRNFTPCNWLQASISPGSSPMGGCTPFAQQLAQQLRCKPAYDPDRSALVIEVEGSNAVHVLKANLVRF